MRVFGKRTAPAAESVMCIYNGGHPVPSGHPFVVISMSRERSSEPGVHDVDDSAALMVACLDHAPTPAAVVQALRQAGIWVQYQP